MESGRLRSLDIRNPYPCLDPDPRRNLPTSNRVPVRQVVVQSGPSRVGTQSGDNYSTGRYPDVPPSSPRVLRSLSRILMVDWLRSSSGLIMMSDSLQSTMGCPLGAPVGCSPRASEGFEEAFRGSIKKPCSSEFPSCLSTQFAMLPCHFPSHSLDQVHLTMESWRQAP